MPVPLFGDFEVSNKHRLLRGSEICGTRRFRSGGPRGGRLGRQRKLPMGFCQARSIDSDASPIPRQIKSGTFRVWIRRGGHSRGREPRASPEEGEVTLPRQKNEWQWARRSGGRGRPRVVFERAAFYNRGSSAADFDAKGADRECSSEMARVLCAVIID
jgi:hypothetical protein